MWTWLDFLSAFVERLAVSWTCFWLGAHRDAMQQVDTRWCNLVCA